MLNHDPKKRATATQARSFYKNSALKRALGIGWDNCEDCADSEEEGIDYNDDSDYKMEVDD